MVERVYGAFPKKALVSLLVAGLVGGGYIEYSLNTNPADDAGTQIAPPAAAEAAPEAPTAPEPIEPAAPVIREAVIPPPPPPPEPVREKVDPSEAPTFTPFTIAPAILNRDEVISAMEQNYPPLLRDAGIGGTVRVYFFIDATGSVEKLQIDQTSGHQPIDDAAMAVAEVYQFSPAKNRDEAVPVWVSFPITFQVR